MAVCSLLSRAYCQQCWEDGRGSSVPPHGAVRRPGGQAASSPYAKGNPAPTRGSQPLCFLKHFDHSHGHCIFILMLRFFFFFKKNLFDLNGCGEVKQAECPPILRGWGGEGTSPSLSFSTLPSPHRSSKALASSNKHFCEKAYLHEDRPGTALGPSKGDRVGLHRRQGNRHGNQRVTRKEPVFSF